MHTENDFSLRMQMQALYDLFQTSTGIQTDSRQVKPGELFFALRGEHFNGNQYAAQALAAGALACIVDDTTLPKQDAFIQTGDVLQTLQELALFHRRQLSIPVLAITGSNGKTTTKELCHAVLSRHHSTFATQGNLNNHIGVPLSLLRINASHTMAIIEMGANHQGEIAAYCRMALPTHGLITNCGKAHLEGFGGIEGVRKGKGELYRFIRESNGCIFRNTDLPYLEDMAAGIIKQVTYGSQGNYKGSAGLSDEKAVLHMHTPGLECTIVSHLVGQYNSANLLAAFAVGHTFNVSPADIQIALSSYEPGNSRSQLIQRGPHTIILDAYNANPSSMLAAITNFRDSSYDEKVLVLGGMKELGSESSSEHEALIHFIETGLWKDVVLVGDEFRQIAHSYHQFPDAGEAASWLSKQSYKATAFLVKGSRAYKMEDVLSVL